MEPFENEDPFYEQNVEPEEPVVPQPEEAEPVTEESPVDDNCQPADDIQPPVYSAPAKKKKKRKGNVWSLVAILCAVASMLVCAFGLTSLIDQIKQNKLLIESYEDKLEVLRQEIENNSHIGSGDSVSGTPNTNVDGGLTPAQVYARNAKSVVAISCSNTENYFGQTMESTSSGSGFILSEDGYIVSNYHVVEGATAIKITTWDGKTYTAKFVGGEESNDIALLKVEAEGLAPVTIGSSDALIVGDQVAAIGNPLGELASTLTVGYVSAKDRIIATDGSQINMLQTDAAINPGNSGGPLFNMKGEVVGITTAKYSGTTSSGASIEGIGFAIPIDDVLGMIEDLKVHGYVTGAYLGVTVSNVPTDDAKLYGLPMGVLVHNVTAGSCADEAGIRAQDIIVDLGGYQVENMNDLTRALRKFKAGDTITLTVYRHIGGESVLSITLDEKPQPGSTSGTEPATTDPTQDWFDHFFGN